MKKKICFLLTVWIMLPLNMDAQKELNWWYFGYKAGLNFNETQTVNSSNGLSTVLPIAKAGPVYTFEGGFSLSDNKGNLLMSSDGKTVYNKKNEVMTNGTGLLGHDSATQSGIVIPAPKNPNKFYVVTVDADYGRNGLRYSVININVSNPNDLGSVEIATKNTVLNGSSYENIVALAHNNGTDYWIVNRTSEFFYVWLLTASGFTKVPQTYKVPPLSYDIPYWLGEIFASVDNTKLISFNFGGKEIISSYFDSSTGVISEIQVLEIAGAPYGGSFAANGNYLYYTTLDKENSYLSESHNIKWDDLRLGNTASTLLYKGISNLRLASDKRIYGIRVHTKNLYVIMNPDEGGTDVRLFENYLTNTAGLGLPTFGSSFFSVKGKGMPFSCAGYETKLALTVSIREVDTPTRLVWDFGDGSEVKEQEFKVGITNYNMDHRFENSGLHKVTVTPYKGTSAFTASSFETNIIDCSIKTNRMIRHELLNRSELEIKK
ncbi:hypothetical protein OIU80_20280 [Flavobacterium sp. LS1R47]|uniref:PKD domain-containing protein n=1 Tax=Flavobacterium frigoritolerans TaxID=2987686 RepID=A0A9X3HNH3_9FLAO|nr:hypothetical protein [Flavobacterium frigoritolerans]MCV9934627.1 hypothetical protein [Flavobacterium frigoritolerans]